MKFTFKIQQFQTDAVEATCNVFRGQAYGENLKYLRDLGQYDEKPEDAQMVWEEANEDDLELLSDTGYRNQALALDDFQLLNNIREVQAQNNIKQSGNLVRDIGRCSLDIEMETGERVIIVTGCINALVSRVSETFIKNLHLIFL